jgi:hypothetical protein
MIVTAQYEGKIDQAREDRILKAFERCGVRLAVHSPIMPGASGSNLTLGALA